MPASTLVPSDEVLLSQLWIRFKVGDEQAFDQLVRMRYRVLFNYATRFTKNRELIKDCIQELLMELWHRRINLVETPYVTIYLIKALRNNLIRLLKKESRRETIGDDWTQAGERLTDSCTTESERIVAELVWETKHTLRRAIDQLPGRQREAVFLKFYEGMSNEAIADIMAVERQTVANFLYRALGNLKTKLPASITY